MTRDAGLREKAIFVKRTAVPETPSMDNTMVAPPGVEDQARLLEDAMVMVRQQTHQMRKCLETPGKLMDALKCR